MMKLKMQAYKQSGPMSDTEATYRARSRDRSSGSRAGSSSRDRVERAYEKSRDPLYKGHRTRRRNDAELSPEMSDDAERSDASETSDMSELSKISTISVRSTQSEKPRKKLSEFASRMESRAGGSTPSPRKPSPLSRSMSQSDAEKNDGSVSDSALSVSITEGHRRRPSLGYKMAALVGLSRKSNSTSQLSGGGKKGKASFQRSEEVGMSADMQNRMVMRQASKDSNDGSIGNISTDSSNAPWLGVRLGPEGHFGDFVEGLGPSQLVGRQVLGSPCLGEIQLGIADRKGHLEVEVIRARGLMAKPGAKILPAPYVKVYLMDGKNCMEKQKTTIVRRTLDPLYQQQLVFSEPYNGRILQITVWGDYGRMERKVFMGVAQVLLDDLDLINMVIGWYKLFTSSSLVTHPSSAIRRNSGSSLESTYTMSSIGVHS